MLAVNEIFGPTVQGEGKSSGKDVMFLRLSGCNLACIWCFVGNTKIATPRGSKKIKEIKVGDIILSSDGKIITPKKVTKLFEREVTREDVVKVLVEGDPGVVNNRVFCTKNHEFFTNRGWIIASDLQVGDEINYIDTNNWYMKNDNPSLHNGKKVVSVTPVSVKQAARFNGNSKIVKVYNLEVEDNHTYFANSFLVHNCDTPYTWNWLGTKFQHPDKYDPKKEVHKMSIQDAQKQLYNKAGDVKALVVSGGEPMLQQDRLLDLFHELKKDGWWIEVETNGTIVPTDYFIQLVDQFNCSPKTSNAGIDNPLEKRINKTALNVIAGSGKGTFKFVVSSDLDLIEIKGIIITIGIKPEQIWLMPEGKTKEEQEKRQQEVKYIATTWGYNFSPRLHILEFGNKRAV